MHVGDLDHNLAIVLLERQLVHIGACLQGRLRLIVEPELGRQRGELLRECAEPPLPDAPLRTLKGIGEALVGEGLEDVVAGAHFEGIRRVAVERRHEHHDRAVFTEFPRQVQPGDLRHLDVEKHDVRTRGADQFLRSNRVGTFEHDVHLPVLAEDGRHHAPPEWLVVHDQRAKSAHAVARACHSGRRGM